MESFQIVAHRGCLRTEPENTFRSFQRAVDLGVDMIELDVHLSRDGEMVVMHDKTVTRTTDGEGAIADLAWSEIAALDAGEGESVPLLPEVLERFPSMAFQIEIKGAGAIDPVLDTLRQLSSRSGEVTVTSFQIPPVVTALSVPGRAWRAGVICGAGEGDKLKVSEEIGADQMFAHWSVVDRPEVAAFRQHGPVDVWLSNDPETVQRAIREGYSGTTSDDPEMALQARASLRDSVGAGGDNRSSD